MLLFSVYSAEKISSEYIPFYYKGIDYHCVMLCVTHPKKTKAFLPGIL